MKVNAEIEVKLTPEILAAQFCEWDHEQQAKVFVEVARQFATWDDGTFDQWFMVGNELRSTIGDTDYMSARNILRRIVQGFDH